MRAKVTRLARDMHQKCITEGLYGRMLTIEYKTTKLINKQKSYTANIYTDGEEELVNTAMKLFNQIWPVSAPSWLIPRLRGFG